MPPGKERVIICPDCGVEVRTRYGRTLRCKECSAIHNKNRMKKMRAEMRAKNGPPQKVPFQLEAYHFVDTVDEIQKCLNCTKPKCNDCLSSAGKIWEQRRKERMSQNAQKAV